jgi:GNAT superfamily N-acetyltransferase
MAIEYREGNAADREAILSLRGAAFGDVDAEKREPDFWDWQFRRGYAGEGHFFVAESEGRLVGHVAFVPQNYGTSAGPAEGVLAVDAMVHPQCHRQGIFSRLTQTAADALRPRYAFSLALQIRKQTLAGMLAGGWRVAERIPVLLAPSALTRFVTAFSRNDAASESIRALAGRDLEQLEAMPSGSNRQARTAAFAQWRYLDNPRWKYEVEGWFAGDALRAFVVHRPAVLKGVRTLAIVDAGAMPDATNELRMLVRHVCQRSRNSLAAALLSRSHAATPVFRRSGFFAGPHRFTLLVQVFDDRFRSLATEPWSLAWGDTDHL